MIKATIGNNLDRKDYILTPDTTLRAALDEAGIDYSRGTMTLDGSSLQAGEMDKTFADLGIAERCFLMNVVKADNA